MVCSICRLSGHRSTKCPENSKNAIVSVLNHLQGRIPITLPEDTLNKMNILIGIVKEVANGLKKGRSECVYQKAIGHELQQLGIHYTQEETMPILYKGLFVGQERLDIILNSWLNIILELKATTTEIKSEMIWQIVSYLRYKQYNLGLIVNFNQSPNRDINYCFIVIQDTIPYIYDENTKMGIPLVDYNYTTSSEGFVQEEKEVPQTIQPSATEVTEAPTKKIIKVKKPKSAV